MKDLIERQAAIEAIAYSIELCNKALDSMTLGGRDRYAVEVERNSLLKLKDDFKLLPSAQPDVPDANVGDTISRQDARRALEAQERQYTFGNDEFNLEAAYHDCKMVFDGITDDDSFQEADTGLILYYANEIIYAIHEALEGKDTNVLSDDCISRQAAIDALEKVADMFPWRVPGNRDTYDRYNEAWNDAIGRAEMEIENMPSAQPEQRWIPFKTRALTDEEEEEHPKWDYIIVGPIPDDGQRILVSINLKGHEEVQSDEFYADDGVYLDSGYEIEREAVAWMPLPEPYREEK